MKLNMRNKLKIIFLSIVIGSLLLSNQVIASEDDSAQDLQIEIICNSNNTKIPGVQFDLYLVGEANENGDVVISDLFGLYNEDIKNSLEDIYTEYDESFKDLLGQLEDYINRYSDRIEPVDSGVTDSNGRLIFPTTDDKLVEGLYLVIGHSLTYGGYRYEPMSFMTFLPYTDSDGVEWKNVRAIPKIESTALPTPSTPSGGGGGGDDEPSVTSGDFPIIEGTLSGSVEESTEEPTTEALPTLSGALPQTGQLWWPIPFLVSGGLLLIILGLIRRRSTDE